MGSGEGPLPGLQCTLSCCVLTGGAKQAPSCLSYRSTDLSWGAAGTGPSDLPMTRFPNTITLGDQDFNRQILRNTNIQFIRETSLRLFCQYILNLFLFNVPISSPCVIFLNTCFLLLPGIFLPCSLFFFFPSFPSCPSSFFSSLSHYYRQNCPEHSLSVFGRFLLGRFLQVEFLCQRGCTYNIIIIF